MLIIAGQTILTGIPYGGQRNLLRSHDYAHALSLPVCRSDIMCSLFLLFHLYPPSRLCCSLLHGLLIFWLLDYGIVIDREITSASVHVIVHDNFPVGDHSVTTGWRTARSRYQRSIGIGGAVVI